MIGAIFAFERAVSASPVPVAIVNTNPDLVRILRFALERAGFVVFEYHVEDIREGTSDIESLVKEHDPKVIVYDVAPPYDSMWNFMQHLRKNTDFGSRKFVLTSVNVNRLREVVGADETVYEVLGREDDIGEVVRAVKEASRARPTR